MMSVKFVFELLEGMPNMLKKTNDFKAFSNILKTYLQRNNLHINFNCSYLSIISNTYSIFAMQDFQTDLLDLQHSLI